MSEISIKGKPISSLRVVDLKEELEKRGLSKNGRKDELLQRLQSFLEVNPEEEDGKDLDGDGTIDVIEASRLEAQQQREQEEAREAIKRQEECLRRERELQELRELVGVSPTREEQRKEDEKRQAEEEKKLEAEKIEKLKREEEEKELRRKEQEEKERLRQEKKERERLIIEEEERKERQAQEDKKRKLEEEERLKIEEERKRKEVQKKLEEEQRKIQEEKQRKAAIQKEEEVKRKEEDEKRKQKEEELWQEEERKRHAEEKKRELESEKEKQEETASIREENRLKEKLLQRLRDDKEKKATEEKADKDTKNDVKSKDGSIDGDGGGEEGGGDDTLVMEINQTDLVTFEELSEDKKEEMPLPAAKPGEVKPLRRLGRNKSGDTSGSERKKRGWGATKTSRQGSTENIEVSSNSLKDIVPDPSNLLTKAATIPEHLELGEDGGDEELQNGHKNGDNHEDDDEIGPSLPKQKRIQDTDKAIRKRISLEESSEEESDTILILNLVRPFTPHQLKEMLKRTGTIQDFWLNKIKSKCCVQFSSVAEASETRMALNGVTWPVDNKNPLHVIFTTHDNMEHMKTSAEEAAERIVVSNGARSGIIPVREWDRDRLAGSEKRRSRSRERRDLKDSSPAPPVQTKSLEELFNKTKATPALYWKPLSEEVIAKKEEARNRRVLAAGPVPAKSSRRRSKSRS